MLGAKIRMGMIAYFRTSNLLLNLSVGVCRT
jgi:hypothetical protein